MTLENRYSPAEIEARWYAHWKQTGAFRPARAGATMPVAAPGTGQVIAHVADADASDVNEAVASARRAFEALEWRRMSVRTRARLINKLADVMEANMETLYQLETLNNGRPLRETRAQLARVPDLFRYNAALAMARRDAVIRPAQGLVVDQTTYHALPLLHRYYLVDQASLQSRSLWRAFRTCQCRFVLVHPPVGKRQPTAIGRANLRRLPPSKPRLCPTPPLPTRPAG